jgi:hypothetical protein
VINAQLEKSLEEKSGLFFKERARNNLSFWVAVFSSCKVQGRRIAGLRNRRVTQQGGKKDAKMGMLFRARS